SQPRSTACSPRASECARWIWRPRAVGAVWSPCGEPRSKTSISTLRWASPSGSPTTGTKRRPGCSGDPRHRALRRARYEWLDRENGSMTSDLAPILRALADGERIGSEEIRAALDDAETTDALVELARRMDGLRQRAAELRAVMSSTKDLLSTTDADMLLQRIVDRAHELIDVDITYLSVYEPARDELYVRAVSGTTSPRFLAMVVPAGVGLASL